MGIKNINLAVFPNPFELLIEPYLVQCAVIQSLQHKEGFPKWSQQLIRQAEKAYNQENYETAYSLLMLLRKTMSDDVKNKCDMLLGRWSLRQGRYHEAFNAFDSLRLRTYRGSNLVPSEVYYNLAKTELYLGLPMAAKENIKMAAARGHDLKNLLLLAAKVASLEKNRGLVRFYRTLQKIFLQKSQPEPDLKGLEKELMLNGIAKTDIPGRELGLEDLFKFKKYLTFNSSNSIPYALTGLAYFRLGEPEKAWLLWSNGLRFKPFLSSLEQLTLAAGPEIMQTYCLEIVSF